MVDLDSRVPSFASAVEISSRFYLDPENKLNRAKVLLVGVLRLL